MLALERQIKILCLLDERGTVRTGDLAEELQVTDETIRRDLQILADERHLTRIHGGASILSSRSKLRSFTERRTVNVELKKAIAGTALSLIHPGKTYAFDSSTTTYALVSILPDLPYRVVTNAYAVLDDLIGMKDVEVISTGGRYHPKTHTFIGRDCINTLHRHNIQTAFISCMGFDIQRGGSDGFEQQAIFKEHLVQLSEEVVLLMDSSKFNQRSEYFFADFGQISRIITDCEVDPAILTEIRGKGMEVTVAE